MFIFITSPRSQHPSFPFRVIDIEKYIHYSSIITYKHLQIKLFFSIDRFTEARVNNSYTTKVLKQINNVHMLRLNT